MAKAVISSTYDDNYFYFIPLVAWLWNRLGVDVICFVPEHSGRYFKGTSEQIEERKKRYYFITQFCEQHGLNVNFYKFKSPEHKEATYAQCSRLYGACLDLPEDEVLITSDVDMAVFKLPSYNGVMTVTGYDLVPDGQQPMCYVVGKAKEWREAFDLNGLTYQQALDRLLGEDECQDYRACRWSVDQEQLANGVKKVSHSLVRRSNGQNQFAQNRIDRDDSFWEDRLNLDIFDAHLWRGVSDDNYNKIIKLLTFMYKGCNFDWLTKYHQEYIKLL